MESNQNLAEEIGRLIDSKKGDDIVILDLRGISSVADYFVIASGNSDRQVVAIADHVEDELAKHGIYSKYKDGMKTGRWVVIDYHDILVHIFHKEERDYYNLERLWNDAKKIVLTVDSKGSIHYN
ncbi:ribosome silencing factor [Acidaminobacter hydrogenoformans]|uniref:Ribosomal silencing factor RsfS n=1 Tax=Acidaminobacter hydrogenoformans DSM 2784 TaxID=1120920 RepID=A0A1G5RSX1_9FIRM|nr:ribosome silencing factor [Acidaminobacter hydrogenoformans]SCZ77194.1 ribosome-associated protein [Acidaminobacter hydrogenoformans DSM 2784]